jgi:hypothetical protein
MTALISIEYLNANFTAQSAEISVSGGTFQLTNYNFLSLQGTFAFDALSISTGMINFSVSPGTSVSGTVNLPVSGSQPTVVVTNFSGLAQLSWPTTTGPQTQPVAPGDPVTLVDFVG